MLVKYSLKYVNTWSYYKKKLYLNLTLKFLQDATRILLHFATVIC